MKTLEEIIKEREQDINKSIEDRKNDNFSELLQTNHDKLKLNIDLSNSINIDEYINNRNLKSMSCNTSKPEYSIHFEDNKIHLKNTSILESSPPILEFEEIYRVDNSNNYNIILKKPFINNKSLEFDTDLVFKLKFGDETFEYNFGNAAHMYTKKSKYNDERFNNLNIEIKDDHYIKFSNNIDDKFHYIMFSYNKIDNKLQYENSSFRMKRDNCFDKYCEDYT
jgi:hypothetical protein